MSHQLYPIIRTRIKDAFTLESGLTPITAPTGSGKTHAVAECIAECLTSEKQTGKNLFVYVTPSKVNRDEFYDRLLSMLPADSEARKRILTVENNVDVSVSASKRANEGVFSLPESLIEGKSFGKTLGDKYSALIGSIKNNENASRIPSAKGLRESARNLVQKAESDFRTQVKAEVENETKKWNKGKNKDASLDVRRYAETVGRQRWGWIEDFWPLSHLDDFDVLIMTPEKFVSTFDTIFEGSQRFTDGSFLKNVRAIVIDESDYVNDRITTKFCDDAAQGDYNPLILLCDICGMMGEAAAASEWFSNRFQRIAGLEKNWADKLASMDEAMAQVRSVCKRHHLDCNLVEDENDGDLDDGGLMFAFNPSDSFGRTIPFVTYDAVGKQNILTKSRPEGKKSVRLDDVIRDCQNALHRLAISIRYVALSYKKGKDILIRSWRNGGSKEHPSNWRERAISMSDAVSTTLNDIRIGEYRAFRRLVDAAQMTHSRLGRSNRGLGDVSVYTAGVTMVKTMRHTSHDSYVDVRLNEVDETPAGLLCQCAEKTSVVLVSASAEVDSVKNFPLGTDDYLHIQLGGKINRESDETRAASMKAARASNELSRSQYAVHVRSFDGIGGNEAKGMNLDEFWRTVFSDRENLRYVCNDGELDAFRRSRLRNRLIAFGEFLDSGSNAGLMFVASFENAQKLCDLMSRVAKEHKPKDKRFWNCMKTISADSWDRSFAEIEKKSADGPVFIITSYPTAGQGKNIQLRKLADMDGYVHVDGGDEQRRDIDFTYLEVPRYILNIRSGIPADQQLKSLLEVSELRERGEISSGDFSQYMSVLTGSSDKPWISYTQIPSVKAWVARTIYQAVGRTTRSAWRRKDTHIVLDPDLLRSVDPDAFKGVPLTYEGERMFSFLKRNSTVQVEPSEAKLARRMAYRSEAEARELRSVSIRGLWTPPNILWWEGIREFIAQHPTVAASERFLDGHSNPALNMYVRVPAGIREFQCRYLKSGDYQRNTEISFGIPFDRLPANKRDDWMELTVSEANSGLRDLMGNPTIEKYFDWHGYAKHWNTDNEYWLVPSVYNNIYKGILGEAACTAILEDALGRLTSLSDHPEIYERFDAYLPPRDGRTTGVMFDFKHWSGYDKHGKQRDEYVRWVQEKLDMVDEVLPTGLVVIVNSRTVGKGSPTYYSSGRILTIPGLVMPDGSVNEPNLEILIGAINDMKGGH